jgi:glycerate kinase
MRFIKSFAKFFSVMKILKILIMPNAFKSTLTATEAADIIERGIKAVLPKAETIKMPVSDGGDGFTEVFLQNCGGVDYGNYAVLPDKTVILETARLCGIAGFEGKNNALTASSKPLGEAFLQALENGYRRFIIGLGGSRTTDCGKGFAEALGMKFTDKNGNETNPGGIELSDIFNVDISGLDKRISQCEITVASDVENPLFGENGAAYIFAPQKGAKPEEVKILDNALRHFSETIKAQFGLDLNQKSYGAAGGLSAMIAAFFGGKIVSGADILLDRFGFNETAKNCDLIITGEGKLDASSLSGKACGNILRRANILGVPVGAVCGDIKLSENEIAKFAFAVSTNKNNLPLEICKKTCSEDLFEAVKEIMSEKYSLNK